MALTMGTVKQSRRTLGTLWRVARLFAIALAVVLLLPYLIVPFYHFVDPVSTLMLWRWVTGAPVVRTVVPLEQIAPALPATVIASEDGQFCTHRGVDLREILSAIEDADDLTDVRGGSTITQQTAKNLFLWGGRSYLRKALELPLALWINLVLPKRRGVGNFLHIVESGPRGPVWGEAAARVSLAQP